MHQKLPEGVSRFVGPNPGPRVIVMGGTHGDEPCGVVAVKRLHEELTQGTLSVNSGELTLILGNLDAMQANRRFIEQNLNRLFKDNHQEALTSEVQRAETLKPLLANIDFLLDLHSTSKPSSPFIMCERPSTELARSISIERVMLGWAGLDNSSVSGDTETWACRHGAQALTVECGQHTDPDSIFVAYRTAREFLAGLGVISGTKAPAAQRFYSLYEVKIATDRSFRYAKTFEGFAPVQKGELIGSDSTGEWRAARDSVVIFPADPQSVTLNTELYFLAEELS